MMLAAEVLSGVLAFVFGSAAVAKLVHQKQQVLTAEKLHISWGRYRWIGVPEAAATAGLLAFRVRVHDSVGFLFGDATLLGLAAATAALLVTAG